MTQVVEQFDPKTLRKFTDAVEYMGHETGLYPGGKNVIPPEHQAAGVRLAATFQPLNADGAPDAANGKIVALVKGHSNCNQYFSALQAELWERGDLNRQAVVLNAAIGGQQLPQLRELQGKVWDRAATLLAQPGFSPLQVQALFLHTTYHGANNREAMPAGEFPGRMQEMKLDLIRVLGHCAKIYPNLKIAYLTVDGFRHYTGFEPHVWREAFATKWLIEDQLAGKPGTAFEGPGRALPWLQWGPYIWNNEWDEKFFFDGVHPSLKARRIFVDKYLEFLGGDPVSRQWLLSGPRK
jgi:hypothetical protein